VILLFLVAMIGALYVAKKLNVTVADDAAADRK
jgi:hypothetical protein